MPTNKPEAVLPELARRAIPFLRDEGANYEDDGSNEPLELAREIEAALAADTLTRPADGEYDWELVAEMLDDLLRAEAAAEERGTTEGRSYFNRDAIAEQARLLRAADNRDAAGVHTATVNFAHLSSCASSPAPGPSIGDFVMVPREVVDRFPEINPSNYDHDDVYALNAWGVELVLSAALPVLLGEAA